MEAIEFAVRVQCQRAAVYRWWENLGQPFRYSFRVQTGNLSYSDAAAAVVDDGDDAGVAYNWPRNARRPAHCETLF